MPDPNADSPHPRHPLDGRGPIAAAEDGLTEAGRIQMAGRNAADAQDLRDRLRERAPRREPDDWTTCDCERCTDEREERGQPHPVEGKDHQGRTVMRRATLAHAKEVEDYCAGVQSGGQRLKGPIHERFVEEVSMGEGTVPSPGAELHAVTDLLAMDTQALVESMEALTEKLIGSRPANDEDVAVRGMSTTEGLLGSAICSLHVSQLRVKRALLELDQLHHAVNQ